MIPNVPEEVTFRDVAVLGYYCLHADSGPHLGVDHDKRMMDDMESYFPREPGEWHLGDLGYVGAERVLYPQKRPAHDSQEPWDVDCEFWTHLIAGYRGRVENVIYKIKSHMWCQTPFRGRFESLCLYYNIAVVLTALELRSRFERTSLSQDLPVVCTVPCRALWVELFSYCVSGLCFSSGLPCVDLQAAVTGHRRLSIW